jgi:hypothetical protein
MDGLTNIDFSVAEAGFSLSYLLAGAKLLGMIVVLFIGRMMEKRPG